MITLSEEQVDDILFYARTGQLEDFQLCVEEISKDTNFAREDIIAASMEEHSRNGPLHMAAANGQLGILQHVIQLINRTSENSKYGVLNSQNAWGNTPLHWATLNGHLEIVKALVAAGASTGLKNQAGHDAVYEAEINSKNEVVEWLLQQDQGVEDHSGDTPEVGNSIDEK